MAFAVMATLAHALRDYCGWQVIAVGRSTIPMVLVAIWAWCFSVRLIFAGPLTLWIRSLAGSISLVCTFFAFTRLPVSEVLTITNLFPVWVALLGWPVLGQKPTFSTWVAIASGLAGVFLIQQPDQPEGNWASLAALTSSFCSAIAMLGLNRLKHLDTRAIVFHFSAVSLLFSLSARVFIPMSDVSYLPWQLVTTLMLFGVGASATMGQVCLTKAFTLGEPAKVSVVGLSQVGFCLLIEVALGEWTMTPRKLLGMALILAPTAWLLWSGTEAAQIHDD
ncbi:MAG: DMT(drug/metabolite transporter) superfamily permease [Planctomycetaceae bacterium]|nr:DMT(drug/metabolite transporter) superfamily permease [Planctomycetaceae bacterium]